MSSEQDTARSGLIFALGAYLMWGFFPLYWRFLVHIPPFEILAHRMVWSLAFVATILGVMNRWAWVRLLNRRTVATYLLAAIFLAINWGVYIWAVNSDFVVETALGYFMTPLINVLFGAAFLGERPRPVQWTAIVLAAIGVLYLTIIYGQLPLIALTLASTFATYGLIKKKAKLGAVESVALESALLFLPALAYVIYAESQSHHFLQAEPLTMAFLAGSGIATMLPLLCFAAAVRRLSLTVLGIMQYIAPSLQFLIGVVIFHEPMSLTRLVGFLFIWSALILFSTESFVRQRTLRKLAK